MTNITYLITGANRGLGKGFVTNLLKRRSTTVIATVRDPSKTQSLTELPKADGSRLIILEYTADNDNSAIDMVSKLQAVHAINAIDIVIANAGIAHSGSPISQNSPAALREHFSINSVGPVVLFQAIYPLLKASQTGNPLFIGMSTLLGSMGAQEKLSAFPNRLSPYGASKAALNWVFKRIHVEEPWLTAFVFHPGLVMTDMADDLAGGDLDLVSMGAITVEQSTSGMLKTIDGVSKEFGGTFRNYDGTVLPW